MIMIQELIFIYFLKGNVCLSVRYQFVKKGHRAICCIVSLKLNNILLKSQMTRKKFIARSRYLELCIPQIYYFL